VPDYDVTLAADRFIVRPGKPLDIPITIQRRNGFDREIELSAADLPEGVTAVPVQSLSGDKSSSAVMLRLNASSGPVSGSIQIHAVAKGEPEVKRTGRASLTGFNGSTPHLWLTVLKPMAEPEQVSPKE
jgi:hypothetical protein